MAFWVIFRASPVMFLRADLIFDFMHLTKCCSASMSMSESSPKRREAPISQTARNWRASQDSPSLSLQWNTTTESSFLSLSSEVEFMGWSISEMISLVSNFVLETLHSVKIA